MNNQDRAAEVIRTWQKRHKTMMDSDPDWAAQNLAHDLHNAGLITPNLPTPTKIEDNECCWDKTHTHLAYDYQTGAEKKIKVPGGVTAFQDENAEVWLDVDYGIHSLALDEARRLGLALLAAVNYMEEA
nr:MAG TPA: hypothetical protein [Caudoviricetes sp.]